jgi:hypothetical protein
MGQNLFYVFVSPSFHALGSQLREILMAWVPPRQQRLPTRTTFHSPQEINTTQQRPFFPHPHPLFILVSALLLLLPLVAPLFTSSSSMPVSTTRSKNKTACPGAPDMTPAQLVSAGLSSAPKKKKTKAQEIAALQEQLRVAHELLSLVIQFSVTSPYSVALICYQGQFVAHSKQAPEDTGGDTDVATDTEEPETTTAGTKRRKVLGLGGTTSR